MHVWYYLPPTLPTMVWPPEMVVKLGDPSRKLPRNQSQNCPKKPYLGLFKEQSSKMFLFFTGKRILHNINLTVLQNYVGFVKQYIEA